MKDDTTMKMSGKRISLADPSKCDLCEACFKAGMKIDGNPNKIIFRVESVSGLRPEEIVSKAADILTEKGQEFMKAIAKL